MSQKLITQGTESVKPSATPIRVVVVTMDTHFASSFARANATLHRDYPGLDWRLHAASEYTGHDERTKACIADIETAYDQAVSA